MYFLHKQKSGFKPLFSLFKIDPVKYMKLSKALLIIKQVNIIYILYHMCSHKVKGKDYS